MLLNLSLLLAPITIVYLHQSSSFSSTIQLFHPPQFFFSPHQHHVSIVFPIAKRNVLLTPAPFPTFLLFRYSLLAFFFYFHSTTTTSTTFPLFSVHQHHISIVFLLHNNTLRIKYIRFLYLIRWECQHCWNCATGVGGEKGWEVLYFSFVLFSPLPSFAPATQVNIGWCQVLTICRHDAARLCIGQDNVRVCCPHNYFHLMKGLTLCSIGEFGHDLVWRRSLWRY